MKRVVAKGCKKMKTEQGLSSQKTLLPEQLSALADGELRGSESGGCLALAHDETLLSRWADYQRIGDVLRAGAELSGKGDELAFVERFRQRLASEQASSQPLMQPDSTLAPAEHKAAAANDGFYRWKMVAGLAGVMAVLVVGWAALEEPAISPDGPATNSELAQQQTTPGTSERLAAAASTWQPSSRPTSAVALLPQGGLSRVSQPGLSVERSPLANPDSRYALQASSQESDQTMIRNPQLDEFLAAHRSSTPSLLQTPTDLVRDVALEPAP